MFFGRAVDVQGMRKHSIGRSRSDASVLITTGEREDD